MNNKYEKPILNVVYIKMEESIAGTSVTGSHNIDFFEENNIRVEIFEADEELILDTHIDNKY